ncbi:MAG TPA: hypothetical protein VEG35_03485 [Burkholderiales bacterium]|nr:hypothetical protein [Burkholderiales bacterium]
MKATASTLRIAAVLAALLVIAGCNPIAKDSKSPSMLIVAGITGTTIGGVSGLILESDVSTGTSDSATATLQAALINPNSLTGPSQYNDITLTGYKIDYTLPDGTGDPGVTVPASMEGTCSSLLIKIGESKDVDFIAVLAAAKVNPPLNAYLGSTTPHEFIAHCTFIGVDGANHSVQGKGQLTIMFADY